MILFTENRPWNLELDDWLRTSNRMIALIARSQNSGPLTGTIGGLACRALISNTSPFDTSNDAVLCRMHPPVCFWRRRSASVIARPIIPFQTTATSLSFNPAAAQGHGLASAPHPAQPRYAAEWVGSSRSRRRSHPQDKHQCRSATNPRLTPLLPGRVRSSVEAIDRGSRFSVNRLDSQQPRIHFSVKAKNN